MHQYGTSDGWLDIEICLDYIIRYNEAIHGLKQPQDMPWQASALEGIVVAGVIDCWLSGHGLVCFLIQVLPLI